jgi:hypothetical protein
MPQKHPRSSRNQRKRMGYLKLHQEVELNVKCLTIWAYDRKKQFVGRLEINRAGLEGFVGTTGKKSLGNLGWEALFQRLEHGPKK